MDTALVSGRSADRSTESSFQAFRCGAPSTTTRRPDRGSAWDQKERPPEVGARLKRCYSELLILRDGDRTAVRLADRALSSAPVYGHGLTKNCESERANVNVTQSGSHIRADSNVYVLENRYIADVDVDESILVHRPLSARDRSADHRYNDCRKSPCDVPPKLH